MLLLMNSRESKVLVVMYHRDEPAVSLREALVNDMMHDTNFCPFLDREEGGRAGEGYSEWTRPAMFRM